MSTFERELARFVNDHRLPDSYVEQATAYYAPLFDWLLENIDRSHDNAFVVGIYGAQGSGKSTLADLLYRCLTSAGNTVVNLSIDDFYLIREERARLAAEVSPLLATRGPPGTHDIDLALRTVRQAMTLTAGESMAIPRFDKATDERVPESEYDRVSGPVDLVILEGWCLGCVPLAAAHLVEPINDLERNDDQDGSWRRFVNASIAAYQPLFELLDVLVMLKTANFESVLQWRCEQEEKLRTSGPSAGSGIMTGSEIARFLQHFERVSRHTEARVERIADVVITQDDEHLVQAVKYR